jgi:hypothetical protein
MGTSGVDLDQHRRPRLPPRHLPSHRRIDREVCVVRVDGPVGRVDGPVGVERPSGACRNLRGDCGGAPVRVSVARRSARFRNRSMDEAGARQRRGGRQWRLWGSCLGAGRGRAEETRRSGCAGEVRRVRFARWGRSALRSSGAAGDGGGRLASRGADVPSCDRAGDGRWV